MILSIENLVLKRELGFGEIPLFRKDPESHELPQIDKYLDTWRKRTQFV